jgi:hypothetical protein
VTVPVDETGVTMAASATPVPYVTVVGDTESMIVEEELDEEAITTDIVLEVLVA